MQQEGKSAESKLGLPEYSGHTLAEKTAFALLILFVGAAAVGAFGGGPASDAVADSASGKLHIEYQRFLRRQGPQLLEITLPTQAGEQQVELTLNTDYLRRVQITEMFPQPSEATSQSTGKLRFGTDGSGEPIVVRVHYRALAAGPATGHVAVATSDSAEPEQAQIKQFVYP